MPAEQREEEVDADFEVGEDLGDGTVTFFSRASDDRDGKFCNGAG